MKLRTRTVAVLPGVAGTARVDRRCLAALRRVGQGDVAVLDHVDLDRALAERLVEAGVVAVVNAASFISGRYPNLGPEVLAGAGVVYLDDEPVASGRELGLADVRELMAQAREGLATQLQGFAHNATEFLRREPDLLLHGEGVPDLDVELADRPVVVVTRDFDWEGDLAAVRRFVAERNPVLIGVDAGADVLL